ncbi:MAG: hypothetical protein AAB855_03110, partial [Patescibacteria group bacterium]
TKNWSAVVANSGVLLSERTLDSWNSLATLVNPETSDLGVSWKLSVSGHSVKDIAAELGVTEFGAVAASGGYFGTKDGVAGTTITSPAGVIRASAESVLQSNVKKGTDPTFTQHLIADIIVTAGSAFLETTLDLVKDGLKKPQAARRQPKTGKGLADLSRYTSGGNNPLYFPNADPNAGTEAFAEATLAVFDELKFTGEQSWDVLNKITMTGSNPLCYDPRQTADEARKASDPESCAIEEDFSQAIGQGLTVQEAMDKGLLNKKGIFGFDVKSSNPDAQPEVASKNYPYNSLVILRKYRVIPVSWELAALYIQQNKTGACNGEQCTLEKLVGQFNDSGKAFYQMIDPNWVLKVPPARCMVEGFGPQIISEVDVPADGTNPAYKQIVRGKACVDYQTCLGQDATGKCDRGWGYCLKEESVMHFTGESCDQKFESCQTFTDTQTRQQLTVLTSSLPDYGKKTCTDQNAGCRWYSSKQNYQWHGATLATPDPNDKRVELDDQNKAKIYTVDVSGVKVEKEWSDATADRVFLASSAKSCQPQAAGCRQVNGPSGTQYLRLPPDSLQCDPNVSSKPANGVKNDVEVEWYKRQDCQQYTMYCKQDYDGCTKYIPEGDAVAITGKVGETCPAACANIYSYAEGKTWFDENINNTVTVERSSLWFSAADAQKCSNNDVGCEEFTNLESGDPAEQKKYYTYLQRCVDLPDGVTDPESLPADEVFYSLVGSDSGGGQPEKHFVVGDNDTDPTNADPASAAGAGDDWQPKCIVNDPDNDKPCDCKDEYDEQKSDPRIGTILCREFVNANGKVFYRYTDNLIYRTSDCTSFRRAIEGKDALPQKYSPSYSRQCSSPAAANCREYRDPQAGNVRVLFDPNYNFEGGTVGEWVGAPAGVTLKTSNEGEIIGDHSMKIAIVTRTGTVDGKDRSRIVKPLAVYKGASYRIQFNAKASRASETFAVVLRARDGTGSAVGSFVPPINKWERYDLAIKVDRDGLIELAFEQDDVTAPEAIDLYLDDIVVKEVDGIEYLIRDSWVENRDGRCFNPVSDTDPTPNLTSPAYQGCSLYRDSQGTQHAIKTFERICPNEMAGCVAAIVKDGTFTAAAGSEPAKLEDKPVYIIPDNNKACLAEDNKCTAYGSPKLLFDKNGGEKLKNIQQGTASKEDWNIEYFKVTPEENTIVQTKFIAGDTAGYGQGICRQQDLGCREYLAGSSKTWFRDPGMRSCQQPAPGKDQWFYRACSNDADIICRADSDCPVKGGIQGTCSNEEIPCTGGGFAKFCPNDAAGCRKVSDPNCKADTKTLK